MSTPLAESSNAAQLRSRLERKVVKSESCWVWVGKRNFRGYGKLLLHGSRGKEISVHRLSHFLATGESPPVVRHRCDNPPCVNPEHLSSGTHAINVKDAKDKGRMSRGEKHRRAKLSDEIVSDIRKRSRTGLESVREIAASYGLASSTVVYAANGTTWNHVSEKPSHGKRRGPCKLTSDDVREIRSRYAEGGVSHNRLADEYGVTKTAVGDAVRRKTWREI